MDEVPGESVTTNNCSAGAEVTVQSGESIPFNAGLNDAWSNSETSGQGFFIVVYPEIQAMFLAWFTFDTERPDESTPALLEEPGHRWLTAQGGFAADTGTVTMTAFLIQGGLFDDPTAVDPAQNEGTITLEFEDCSNATMTYDLIAADAAGSFPLIRILEDNAAQCAEQTGVPAPFVNDGGN